MEELYNGKDDVISGVKLRTSKSHVEQPIQYFYPLEVHCDMEKSTSKFKHEPKETKCRCKRIQAMNNSSSYC